MSTSLNSISNSRQNLNQMKFQETTECQISNDQNSISFKSQPKDICNNRKPSTLFNRIDHSYLGKTITKLDSEVPDFDIHSDTQDHRNNISQIKLGKNNIRKQSDDLYEYLQQNQQTNSIVEQKKEPTIIVPKKLAGFSDSVIKKDEKKNNIIQEIESTTSIKQIQQQQYDQNQNNGNSKAKNIKFAGDNSDKDDSNNNSISNNELNLNNETATKNPLENLVNGLSLNIQGIQDQNEKRLVFRKYLLEQRLKTIMKRIYHDIPSQRYNSLNASHFKKINDLAIDPKHFKKNKSKYQYGDDKQMKYYFYSKGLKTNLDIQTRIQKALNYKDQQTKHKNKKKAKSCDKMCSRILYFLDKKVSTIKVLNPQSPFVIIFDLISASIIMFWVFIYSLHIFFFLDISLIFFMRYALMISNIFYIIEIIMRLNIGHYSLGRLVKNRKQIFYRYTHSNMIFDFIGIFVQVYNLYNSGNNIENYILELLFHVKIFSFLKISYTIENLCYLKGYRSHIVQLAKMLFQITVMSHWIGCFWYWLQIIEIDYNNETQTWLQIKGFYESNIWVKYAESFYFAVATTMLIGSSGSTYIETIYIALTVLLTVGVFAYLISTISMLLEELNRESQTYKRDLEVINRYMKTKNLTQDTQSKIRSYIEYQFINSSDINTNMEAKKVLDSFPKLLKDDIYQEINQYQLEYFKFIIENFSKKTQDRIKSKMQEKNFLTNEKFFSQHQHEDIEMFLVTQGKVQLYYSSEDKKYFNITKYKKGDVLGDINFITGLPYDFSAKSLTFSTASVIRRKDFIDILKLNKEDFEKFNMIKQNISLDKISKYYKNRICKVCYRESHTEQDCNLLNYRPSKMNTYLRNNYSQPVLERQMYKRYNNHINAFDGYLIYDLYEVFDRLQDDEDYQNYCQQFSDDDDQDETTESDEDEGLYYSHDNSNKKSTYASSKNHTTQTLQTEVDYSMQDHQKTDKSELESSNDSDIQSQMQDNIVHQQLQQFAQQTQSQLQDVMADMEGRKISQQDIDNATRQKSKTHKNKNNRFSQDKHYVPPKKPKSMFDTTCKQADSINNINVKVQPPTNKKKSAIKSILKSKIKPDNTIYKKRRSSILHGFPNKSIQNMFTGGAKRPSKSQNQLFGTPQQQTQQRKSSKQLEHDQESESSYQNNNYRHSNKMTQSTYCSNNRDKSNQQRLELLGNIENKLNRRKSLRNLSKNIADEMSIIDKNGGNQKSIFLNPERSNEKKQSQAKSSYQLDETIQLYKNQIAEQNKEWVFMNLDKQHDWDIFFPLSNLKSIYMKYKQKLRVNGKRKSRISKFNTQHSKQMDEKRKSFLKERRNSRKNSQIAQQAVQNIYNNKNYQYQYNN